MIVYLASVSLVKVAWFGVWEAIEGLLIFLDEFVRHVFLSALQRLVLSSFEITPRTL